MGVSIEQWRMQIGCNKSLSRNNILYFAQESPLTSSTSSTRSRYASRLAALILILAILFSPIYPQWKKNSNSFNSSDQSCSPKSEINTWACWPSSSQLGWCSGQQQAGPLQYLSSKQRNKKVRAINGNRERRGIRLAHWNAGSAHLPNKMNQLELAVADHHPHLLGISEANFRQVYDLEDVQLADYEI